MGNKNRRQVAVSQHEAERVAKAEQLQRQSKQDFESVYGSTQPGTFNPEDDKLSMLAMESIEAPQNTIPPQDPQMPPQQPQVQTQPQVPVEQQQAPEEQPKEEEQGLVLTGDPAEDCRRTAAAIAGMISNPPTADQLYNWRMIHGNIFILPIEDKIFIYRYLKRQEWIQMNAVKSEQITQLQVEDQIFNRCLLWPVFDVDTAAALPANTVGMITEQIRIRSMFLDPNYVATLTIKI